MANVIGVRFENAGKLFFFEASSCWPTPGDFVLVETTHGLELGEVVMPVHELADDQIKEPLQPVVRVASAEDVAHHKENREAEKKAFEVCQHKIAEHKLDMKLVKVEYTFDNSKLLFYFTANGRVDFRSLVKDLAGVFRTRIELRQIGVRDEAKMLGGLGPCGRPICCGTFLGDFEPVSIKMAKEQNLSLNPTKISGVCGRLMCCLKYEEDTYSLIRKSMPRIGREVMTPDGPGTVWDQNIIKESVRVRVQKGDSGELKDYPITQLTPITPSTPFHAPAADTTEAVVEQPAEQPSAPAQKEAEASQPAHESRPHREREKRPQHDQEPRKAEHKKTAAPTQKPSTPAPASVAADGESTKSPAEKTSASWKAALERAMQASKAENSDVITD